MQKWQTKVYVVLQRMNIVAPGGLNLRVLDVFLTRQRAQDLVDATPGTWIEKHVASK